MKKVLENQIDYKSFMVVDTKKENYQVIYTKDTVISTGEAIKFWISSFAHEPFLIINNYITNYLATTSIYDIEFDGMKILIDRNLNFKSAEEIEKIGFKIYGYANECVFCLSEDLEPYATEYRTINKPLVAINYIMRNMQLPSMIIMKIIYLILPFLAIISIVSVFVTRKKYNEKYTKIIDLITILYNFSFLHILVHALLGSTIDRYTMPALITTIIAILLTIYAIAYRKKYKITK